MRKRENNRLNAYNRVMGVLKSNSELFDGTEVFKSAVEEFSTRRDELFKIEAEIKKGSKPVVYAKNKMKRRLALEGAGLASIIALYAYEHRNIELEKDVRYSYSDLYKSREALFIAKIGTILEIAEKNADVLKDYRVSGEDLAAFRGLAVEFTSLAESAGEAVTRRIANNKRSRELMNEIEELLTNRIDRIVLIMKQDHPDFYRAYHAARQIINL